MKLRELIQYNYKIRREKDYIFTRVGGIYKPVTFGYVIESAVYLARALNSMGLYQKKIIVYGENSVEWMIADLAIMAYVGINIGIDKEWKVGDVSNTIDMLSANAIIYSETKENVINLLRDDYPMVTFISMKDFPALIQKGKEASAGFSLFDFPKKSSTECIRVVFSSGTLSFPKAVMLSDKNIFSGWESFQKRAPLDENDVCYLFLPLHHTYAGIYNFLYSLLSGISIYLGTHSKNIAEELLIVNPTVFCGVPLIYRRFYEAVGANIGLLGKVFGSRIRYLFCGGAYLDETIRKEYLKAGLNLLIAYALSETGSSFAIEYSHNQNTKSVGTVYEDIDVIIADANEKGEGEIRVKGDNVFLGYMNNPEATKRAFDENGYFCTGDLGYMDPERNLYLVGRKKKMLLMENGENIYPENIEERMKRKNPNISKVRICLDGKLLHATLYIQQKEAFDYDSFIKEINDEAVKNEKISKYEIIIDSVDARMKQ